MKYKLLVAGVWSFMKPPFQKELCRRYDRQYADALLKSSKPLYREIVERTPFIGGMKNRLSVNLIWAAMLIAIYKTANGKLTVDEIGDILYKAMENSKVFAMFAGKSKPFTKEYQENLRQIAEHSQKSTYEYDWCFQFLPGKDLSEFSVHYSQCGICKLCQTENCFELAKQMCKLDYVMVKYMGAELTRTKTIGNGDDICDFKYSKNK